ncbi:unnamed protein product [Closterium sp. Yama58-4]|nr:unnamed protein product [Closterium sp. Yama58-4]
MAEGISSDRLNYGGPVFFHVRLVADPMELLPERVTIAINERGVHFFRTDPEKYLYTVKWHSFLQIGTSPTALLFKMGEAESPHFYQFETTKSEEICGAIKAHVNYARTRRLARERAQQQASARFVVPAGSALEQRSSAELGELAAKLADTEQQLKEHRAAVAHMREEVKETREEMERKLVEHVEVVQQQRKRIEELEKAYKEEAVLRKRYYNKIQDMYGKIRVNARSRPLNGREQGEGQKMVVEMLDEYTLLLPPSKDGEKPKEFQFDRFFYHTATQETVFKDIRHLTQSAIDGFNVCVFSYGQTGSGKTHTIYGDDDDPGLTPRAMEELFRRLDKEPKRMTYKLQVYMVELYMDKIIDLLLPKTAGKKTLKIKKDEKNATLIEVDKLPRLREVVQEGMERRVVAGTHMNAQSSRSHLVLSIIVETTDLQTEIVSCGKLSFVDLAGSERLEKSGSEGKQKEEAKYNNRSLSALARVFAAQAQNSEHTPYRDEDLTYLMSDSVGGNAKTIMFVNISPASGSLDETADSLDYAMRVRSITNEASKNVVNKEVQGPKSTVERMKKTLSDLIV